MGFFAFYCGIVYNEFFSIPLKLFPSCYTREFKTDPSALPPTAKEPEFTYKRTSAQCVPSVGFDSVWFASSQEVSFVNSFKMKLSIIVGVTHMCLGILMKGVNDWHFGNPLQFLFEFIPQLVFLLVTFGYMCAAIIIKWLKNWGDGSGAPSIISIFINVGESNPTTGVLWGDADGHAQTVFQQRLFLIAFLCVLLMLIPKPLALTIQMTLKKKKAQSEVFEELSDDEEEQDDLDEINEQLLGSKKDSTEQHDDHGGHHEHEEHSVGEIWVDQLIETIEFVLGSISNTASYLRLWALSLAHGQLAKVFLTMTLMPGIASGNILVTLLGFPMFLTCTFGVLIVMDAMECFLHTLRLHWVEFQNKFYKADGIAFKAYSLNTTVSEQFQAQLDKLESLE